jgi:hypothetical protein
MPTNGLGILTQDQIGVLLSHHRIKINKSKRRYGMNHIQQIKDFLKDFETLNPDLKSIISWAPEYYEQKLIKEYVKLGQHPFPTESLHH